MRRVSVDHDDPGYIGDDKVGSVVVFFNGVEQGSKTGRLIFTADEASGEIVFAKIGNVSGGVGAVETDGDTVKRYTERGIVEVRDRVAK